MAKTIGPVERPMVSRKSSTMDQSISTCLVKGVECEPLQDNRR